MKRIAALLFAFAASAAFAAGAAVALPTEINAEYRLTANAGVPIGHVAETFVRSGDTYTIQSVTRSEGVLKVFFDDQVTLESTGRFGAGGLQPLRFGQRRANDSSGDIKATFDWEKGVMHSLFKGEEKQTALPKETQDRISVMYQFMNLKRQGDVVVMPMSNGRKVELYTYRLVDEPRVVTPAGEFDTFHYARVVDNPKDSRAEVWLAKDHFNFPVRVLFNDSRGLRVEQTLESLQAR